MSIFAVNYSPRLAELVRAGQVTVECFKCPAWPDLIQEAQQLRPVYIHFPLIMGRGVGYAKNSETHREADLDGIARMMEGTDTPYVNTHFFPPATDAADQTNERLTAQHARRVIDGSLRDLEPLIKRFGAEKVLVENCLSEAGIQKVGTLPETISQLMEESGCGFLFDLAHARIAANSLGMPLHEYVAGLPLQQVKEIHVTGVRVIQGEWLELLERANTPGLLAEQWKGKMLDHLPMCPEDWQELSWMLGEIQSGHIAEPWVLAFEYGGVGGFWEALGTRESYLEQLPRMSEMMGRK